MKKLVTLALAGALALPFSFGHGAHAQTQAQNSQPMTIKYYFKTYKYIIRCPYSGASFDAPIQAVPNPSVKTPAQNTPAKPSAGNTTAQKPPVQTPSSNSNQNKAGYTLSQFEQKVVDLTNQERAKQGLAPLKIDTTLSKMARDKAQDMRDKNYFSHQSPTYGSPFDMMKKYGITYRAAGENIAAGQKTPEEVVNAWMNSEGHRANILNPNYTAIGVGYVQGGSYGSYWVQEFIGK